ncbi:hypothetical protein LCGC14_1311220 [marine sediment metagenome]|uniref:Tyr recombinase domain-containing protein n=1 Tax=marine sediment metagenome TaxID=412755 RepID=A0A0F9N3I5_9ZZZZ
MKTYLDPEEVQVLEEAATNLRDRLLIRMFFRLGYRASEAVGLEVEDVDLQEGALTIEHLKVRLNLYCPECGVRLGKSHQFCPGCGSKVEQAVAKEREHRRVRTLPLDRETLEMLQEYIRRGGPVQRDGKTLIFGMTRYRAWQVVRECATRAGFPPLVNPETGRAHGVSPHRLRDAFAVMAVQLDDSTDGVRMLQEHLGHQNIGTTMRYRKVAGQELREWYEKLWNGSEENSG